MKKSLLFVMGAAITASLLGGCGAATTKACRVPMLAGAEMQLDRRLNDDVIADHVYFSKEGSSGGRSFGGGGCGCN